MSGYCHCSLPPVVLAVRDGELASRPRFFTYGVRTFFIVVGMSSTGVIGRFKLLIKLEAPVLCMIMHVHVITQHAFQNKQSHHVMVASYLSSSYLISAPILSNLGAHLISSLIYGCGLVSSRTFWYVPLHSDVIDDIT